MRRVIIVLFLLLPLSVFAQRGDLDEETQPIGLEHFSIKDIAINGHSESFNLIDLNNDGIKEIIYIQTETASLEILSYDKSNSEYRPKQTIKIPAGAMIIYVGNYLPAGGAEIAFYTSDSVFCYKQADGSGYNEERILLASEQSIFYPSETNTNALPLIKEGADINNDGIDDLIIPTKDGYLICWGPYENAKPARKQIINQPASHAIKTSDSSFITISSALPHVSLKDLNGDGLKDVALGFPNRLNYYFQNKANGFFPEAPSGEFRMDFLAPSANQSGSNVLLYSNQFADLNADGFMDLVIASTSGDMSDIGNMVTRIFIFLNNSSGNPAPNGSRGGKGEISAGPIYSTPPAQVINLKGICPLWGITEINGDNYPDLFIISFKFSLIKKAVLGYIPIIYQVYLNTAVTAPANKPGKNFPMAPDYERNVSFPSSFLGKGTGYFSHIYFGYDYNADNRTDLLTISGPEKKKGAVTIYCGRQKDKLTRPDGVSFEKDELLLCPVRIPDKAVVADLNNDKKNDIILQYKSKLTILMAK
ncbi:MAG: VCBS repeat-containing protein [Planctomycetes bacterium]|nr:VCBS repeat-containing protein [Planctomycetota bacterium]